MPFPSASRWFAYYNGRPASQDGRFEPTPREAFNEGWRRGAMEAMRESARLSPYVNQFLHMLVLIGYADERYMETRQNRTRERTRTRTAFVRTAYVRALRRGVYYTRTVARYDTRTVP